MQSALSKPAINFYYRSILKGMKLNKIGKDI